MSSERMVKLRRVVVSGLGAVTPLGNRVAESWTAALAGTSGAGRISHFDATNFKTRFACEVKNFDPRDYVEEKEIKKLDPCCYYSLAASAEALRDSGLDLAHCDRTRIGVIWGSGVGGLATIDDQLCSYAARRGNPRFSPFFITKLLANMSAGLIAIKHGLQGINFATVSACASSAHAITDAVTYLRLGRADVIVAGGAEAGITESGVGGFNAMKALSERNDDALRASRPFAADRDGFVIGEGAGALILETLEHALARGARIYAEIIGTGFSADAYHMTAPHPDGAGIKLAVNDALRDAGATPDTIDHINAHATSTLQGDLCELNALQGVFGARLAQIAVSATKSMTGHLLGAAGAVETIFCVLALRDQIAPPTINTEELDPALPTGFVPILGRAQARPIKRVLNNNFGFGGHNVALILETFNGA